MGSDPYVVPPQSWASGHDPVASASRAAVDTAPTIYGPVATAMQALCSVVGGDSLQLTVWLWQLCCLAGWLAVGWLVIRLCRNAFAVRRLAGGARWMGVAANPVLLARAADGAHVDLLGAAFAVGALALAGRRPLLAGMRSGPRSGSRSPSPSSVRRC